MTYSCEHTTLLYWQLARLGSLLEIWRWLDFTRLVDFASCKLGHHFMMASLLRKNIDQPLQLLALWCYLNLIQTPGTVFGHPMHKQLKKSAKAPSNTPILHQSGSYTSAGEVRGNWIQIIFTVSSSNLNASMWTEYRASERKVDGFS